MSNHGVIVVQPGDNGQHAFIPSSSAATDIPPGLEYLSMVDTIVVHQMLELIELITNYETKNKYYLKNAAGDQIYFALEESTCCERQCCGKERGFHMHVLDNLNREVMIIRRPYKCCAGGCGSLCSGIACCANSCFIEAPPGRLIGQVQQSIGCCSANFLVQDAYGIDLMKIEGPPRICLLGCQDKEFAVATMDGHTVLGAITKKWSGLIREKFSDADIFRVDFPADLDVRMKATLIGAVFLLDYMEFETDQREKNKELKELERRRQALQKR